MSFRSLLLEGNNKKEVIRAAWSSTLSLAVQDERWHSGQVWQKKLKQLQTLLKRPQCMYLLRLLNDRILIKYWLCCYLKFTPQPSQHLTKSEVFKKQIVWQNMHLQTLICPAPCPPSRRCIPTTARFLPTATPARKKSRRRLHIAGRKLGQKEETLRETVRDIGTEKFTTGQAWTQVMFQTAKSHQATQAEDAAAPGIQPTQTWSMAPGDVVAQFSPAADRLPGAWGRGPLQCIGVERSTRQHVYTPHCPTWWRS